MTDRPNVILIVLDTARADAFEPYGAPAGASPTVAQLAASGTALEARSNACWTLPSHASLFTGLLPRRSGLIRMPGDQLTSCQAPLHANADRLLPEVFRRSGYETRAVSANLWVSPATGFDYGFDEFVAVDSGRQAGIHSDRISGRAKWLIEGARARVDDGAAEAEQTIGRWIGQPRDAPFFWFVNLIEAHSPYLPPKPYNDLGIADRVRAASEARRYLTLGAIWKACAGGFEVPAEVIDRMRYLYAASIRQMDDWLARLLEALDTAGALDQTILIVTSDHGENFGEGGLMGHSFSLDDRLTRIPMIWAGTGAPAGPVSFADVPGLLATAAELPSHPWETASGEPIVAEFDPPTGRDDPRVAGTLADWGLGDEAIPLITSHLTSAVREEVKLTVREHTEADGERVRGEELYELGADPLEERPLRGREAESHPRYAELKAAIERSRPAGDEAPQPVAPGTAPEISEDERQALEEKMRLLGYM